MRLSGQKDLRKIMREAESAGWNFTRRKGNHIIARHADGVRSAVLSASFSDYRTLKNIRKDLGL